MGEIEQIMRRLVAVTQMQVGVSLRTEIVDDKGMPSSVVRTDGALRSTAFNLGVISLRADISTETIGSAVTNKMGSDHWTSSLILPAYAGKKVEEKDDTKLTVVRPDSQVAFQTIVTVERLANARNLYTERYASDPLEIFAKTDTL
jgi:hypothetical protein